MCVCACGVCVCVRVWCVRVCARVCARNELIQPSSERRNAQCMRNASGGQHLDKASSRLVTNRVTNCEIDGKVFASLFSQERDWPTLQMVLSGLPDLLRNKTIVLSAQTAEIDHLAQSLVKMVRCPATIFKCATYEIARTFSHRRSQSQKVFETCCLTRQYHHRLFTSSFQIGTEVSNRPVKLIKSTFHSHVLPTLGCLVSYSSFLSKERLVRVNSVCLIRERRAGLAPTGSRVQVGENFCRCHRPISSIRKNFCEAFVACGFPTIRRLVS